ncbi:MAG: CerR family C-terminal domain-containing protein [Planctomycetota bacterium]
MVISHQRSALDNSAGTVRDRLLGAAEQLFAEQGYDGTSIRDLAAAAGCNIASVNYYFGGKEKLYVEIWRRHLLVLRDTRVASIDKVLSESGGKPDLENLLRSFAHSFIGPLVDENEGPRLIRLMAREMINPHLPANVFAEEVIMPTLSAMQNALSKACPELAESKIPLVVFSLVGQLVHTIRFKTMLGSMDDETLPKFEPAEVIDHIVAFTAAGIRAYAGGIIE